MKFTGRWRYLYRAVDREGQLLDSMLREHRDKHEARRFLRRLADPVVCPSSSGCA